MLHNVDSSVTPDKLQDWQTFYNAWHMIIASQDEQAFDSHVQELEQQFALRYPEEVTYIKQTWLDPYKEKLVKAWVD